MTLSSQKARLLAITKELTIQWQATKEQWQDAKSREFEQKYIDELEAQVGAAAEVIERLDRMINRIHQDCE